MRRTLYDAVTTHSTRVTEGVGIEPIWHERITKESRRTKQKNDHEGKIISRDRQTGEKQRRNGSDQGATPSVTRVGEVLQGTLCSPRATSLY